MSYHAAQIVLVRNYMPLSVLSGRRVRVEPSALNIMLFCVCISVYSASVCRTFNCKICTLYSKSHELA